MAPAIRKVIQTIIQPDATSVSVIDLGNTKRWSTLSLVESPVSTPTTPIVQFDKAKPPVGSYPTRSTGLSATDKGVIAGCAISVVVVLLLLLCWCYLRPSPWSFRSLRPKVPSVPKDPPPETTPADPAPADNPSKKKKTVTISADLPRYFGKSTISPLVRYSTEFTSVTGLEIREGRSGPIRFMIRQRDRPRRKRRRRHRSKVKGPEDG
ncbi:uncharacterized protein N7515_006248 [Penicillium bovifimosum]|uniref:Uncharacterized protein n=1 Tax=Penicillium bovifimosum TaxID=126998 RepID=A0A9W9GVW4_9EURO|nr:uncharacterized protein N7515_006248 [Penicillium bovifimosum]KAJ5130209.1 hypothetical protein N7515_006248 [Penicillium bovifimosum]